MLVNLQERPTFHHHPTQEFLLVEPPLLPGSPHGIQKNYLLLYGQLIESPLSQRGLPRIRAWLPKFSNSECTLLTLGIADHNGRRNMVNLGVWVPPEDLPELRFVR